MRNKIIKYAHKYSENPFIQFIINSIPYFGQAFDKSLTTISEKSSIFNTLNDFNQLYNYIQVIDEKILLSIRKLEHLSSDGRVEIYKDIINGNISKYNLSIVSFFERLPELVERIFKEILDEITLKIEMESNFNRIIFKTASFEVSVKKPVLMWDCHCPKPNGVIPIEYVPPKITKCQIHSNIHGDELTDIIRNSTNVISYDNVKVLWKQSAEFWPPSIDTFHMCQNLLNEGITEKYYNNILDLGSGTGFLGVYFGIKNTNIKKIYLADWLITPLILGTFSWKLNNAENKNKNVYPLLGINTNWILSNNIPLKFDLCVCNPPYLPDLQEFPEIKIYNTVGGTDLLEHIIFRSFEVAQDTYINFSDIALNEAKKTARRSGINLRQIGKAILVPFRVPQAFNCKGYIEKLIKEKRLIHKYKSRYKYWHNIRTYKLER